MRTPALLVGLCCLAPAFANAETEAPQSPAVQPELTTSVASTPAPNPQPAAVHSKMSRWAFGLATSWARRRDFGTLERSNFIPELVAQHYIRTDERVYLRPGLRLGYAGLSQAEMPQDLQIQEREGLLRGELAAIYDGPAVPMVAIGAGLVLRSVRLATSGAVESRSDPISHMDFLPELSIKTGLGLPFLGGAALLEPHVGFRYVHGDDREGLFYGIDATFALPH